MRGLVEALNDVPLAGLMLVVALGFTLGRVAWRGVSLGPAGGTLFVALLFGSLGLSFRGLYGAPDPELTVGLFGFCLFIYSVGFEAGPRFFSSLVGGPGWRFVVVGTAVNVLALLLAVAFGRLLGLGDSATAGLLSGALTSAPTYAAADRVCSDPSLLAVTFALTYPVGLAGVVLAVQFLPRLMRDDLAAGTEEERVEHAPRSPELTRAFEVKQPGVVGKSLAELDLTHRTGCYVTRVHRGHEFLAARADTVLEEDDHLLVRGRLDELQEFAKVVGPEIYDDELRKRMPPARRIVLTGRAAANRTLKDLGLTHRHRCLVIAIRRGRVVLEPWPELPLERGDVLEVVGPRDGTRAAAAELGRFERRTDETDIAVYAGGIFLGVLLGTLHLGGFGFDFTLGLAGGLLIAGVVLGRYQRIGPIHAHVPASARQLVRDLGILLFVAETGVRAGQSSMAAMREQLVPVLGSAVAVTLLPVLGAALLARWALRMRPADAWGSIGGGMTSSAALVAVRRAADSNEPALSYAASYAFASVLVTVAGQVVVFLMR